MIDFNEFTQRADDCGVRLEFISGLPTWEMLPNLRYQETIDRVRQTFRATATPTGQSRGYEKKDLELGSPFYLEQGIKDVFVLDPYTLAVRQIRADGEWEFVSPYDSTLACGCQVTF